MNIAMKLACVCATFFAVTAGDCQANDAAINPDIQLQNLDRAFEIAAADLGLATVIYNGDCQAGPPASCSFEGAGTMEIRGIAKSLDAPPSNISLFYTADGDPTPFGLNVGLLVSIAEPQLAQSERGKIIAAIMKAAGKGSGLVDGKNAAYSATRIGDVTIVVTEKR